jgi:DNA-binding transcriptional LysR family regulator
MDAVIPAKCYVLIWLYQFLQSGAEMQLSDRVGCRMKLRHLHVLVTVVQAGSMKKAAELLNTSQPAISRSIADLEHTIGVRLLDRNTQGIEPTEYGRVMLKHGVAAFDELKQGVKNIEFLAHPGAGEVRIGSSPYIAEIFVSAVIKRLTRRYPRIVFHLVTADETDRLHRELSERNVDLLIARRAGSLADEKLGFELLYDSSFVVAAGARNPWVRKRRIALAELVNESWVLPPPEGVLGPAYLEVFRASGLDYPRTAVFAAPPGVRLNLLAAGRFLTIVPISVLRLSQRPGIKILPVKLQYASVPVGIITLKSRTLSPILQLFIDDAREVAKPLARRKW